MFFWYQYVFLVHDKKLDDWYFTEVYNQKLEDQNEEEDEAGVDEAMEGLTDAGLDVTDFTINTDQMGGQALEF